ncbi:actin-binding protein anillin-like protein [Leptotrombidium deliense]|uniref:Actin-binding protein anillin-like protein n=1 Tax=Leptotrombidium deliense TaxID=299467 RepID=A0A443SRA3_9ACAR|nr:actin-binding protein anillin-like protein [Leptotrombidium deliense]
MSVNEDDIESYAEYIAARAKARKERLQKLKLENDQPIFQTNVDKENEDNNQTVAVSVKVDTPACESKSHKEEIASKRARRFEDILKRSEDEENHWEYKRPDYKNQKKELNTSWTKKFNESPRLTLTPTSSLGSPKKSFTPNLSVEKSASVPKQETSTKSEISVSSTKGETSVSSIEQTKAELFKDSPKSLETNPIFKIVEPVATAKCNSAVVTNENIESPTPSAPSTPKGVIAKPLVTKEWKKAVITANEKPKDLQQFFSKSKAEEQESEKAKTFAERVNMFQNLQEKAVSKPDMDPSELPLSARKLMFEKAMLKGSDTSNRVYVPIPKPLFPGRTVTNRQPEVNVEETKSFDDTDSEKQTYTDMEITSGEVSEEDNVDNVDNEINENKDIPEIPTEEECEKEYDDQSESNVLNQSVISALKDIDNLSSYASSTKLDQSLDTSSERLYPELPSFQESEHELSYALETSSPQKGANRKRYSDLQQVSPIKKFSPPEILIQPQPARVEKCEKPPMRTLSMYRREQKMLAAMNSPSSNTLDIKEKLHREEKAMMQQQRTDASDRFELLRRAIAEQHNAVIAQTTTALNIIYSSGEFVNSKEHIEAEKILLVATQRRIRAANEMARLKRSLENNDFCVEAVSGSVILSNIMLHVKGDFVLSQVGKYDKFKHRFICLIHCNGTILPSDLVSAEGVAKNACLVFPNEFRFDCLKSNFKIEVEVYGLALPKVTKESKKEKTKFLSLTPNKTKKYSNSPKCSPGGPNVVRGSKFVRLGVVELDMMNRFDSKHSLKEFVYDSPLDGTLQLTVNTGAEHRVSMRGDLNFQEVIDGHRSWNRRWCVLKGYFLAYWRFEADETTKESLGVIDLRKCVNPTFGPLEYEICSRKNSFAIVTVTESKIAKDKYKTLVTTKHFLATDTKEEFEVWSAKLEELVTNIRLWEFNAAQAFDSTNFAKSLK